MEASSLDSINLWNWQYFYDVTKNFLHKVIKEVKPEAIVTINRKGSACVDDVKNQDPLIFNGIDICDIEIKKTKKGFKPIFYDQNLIESKKLIVFDDFVNTGQTVNVTTNYLSSYGVDVNVVTMFASTRASTQIEGLLKWRQASMESIPHMFAEWTFHHAGRLGLERFSKDTVILKCRFYPRKALPFLLDLLTKTATYYKTNPGFSRPKVSDLITIPLRDPEYDLKIYFDERTSRLDLWVHTDRPTKDEESDLCSFAELFCLKKNVDGEDYPFCPTCSQLRMFNMGIRDTVERLKNLAREFNVALIVENLECDSLAHQLGSKKWDEIVNKIGYQNHLRHPKKRS
jgi:hypoxanthine phosphoribosyltransferase